MFALNLCQALAWRGSSMSFYVQIHDWKNQNIIMNICSWRGMKMQIEQDVEFKNSGGKRKSNLQADYLKIKC